MTPPSDNLSQRQRHLVLGDLLELQLPEIDWSLDRTDRPDAAIVGNLRRWQYSSDEEIVRPLRAYVDHFQVAPRKTHRAELWALEFIFEGVPILIYAEVSTEYAAEHEPPSPALPPRADMYVRRSNGQLAETTSC